MMQAWRVVVAALAVGLAACGGGEKEHAEFGTQVMAAVCERHVRCGQYASADACEQDLSRRGWDAWMGLGTRYDEALDDGRLRFDSEAARQCLDAIRQRDCRLPVLPEAALTEGIEFAPGCAVIRDARSGEECESHLECGDGAYCEYTSANDCQGVCQLRRAAGSSATRREQCATGLAFSGGRCLTPVGEGSICYVQGATSQPVCAPGLWCDGERCRRTGAEGDACVSGNSASCGASFVCKNGFCASRSRRGAACEGLSATGTLPLHECQEELFCDADAATAGTCQPRLGEGAACRSGFDCAEGLACTGGAEASGAGGTCTREAGLGEECNLSTRPCGGGLTCAGLCVRVVRQGEPCESPLACATGSACWEGRCIPQDAFACQ